MRCECVLEDQLNHLLLLDESAPLCVAVTPKEFLHDLNGHGNIDEQLQEIEIRSCGPP